MTRLTSADAPHPTAKGRHGRHLLAPLWFLALEGGTLAAQDTLSINIYRFVLGVDVPESPALVAMGVAPAHVLLAGAPKPVALSVLEALPSSGNWTPGLAVDVAPYFLAGGGIRTLGSYHSGSLRGRLLRVVTKTLISVGAVRDPADPVSSFVGLGLRSTFHDPHDPLDSPLPSEVAAALARGGEPAPEPTEEDVTERGVAPLFARARRDLRRPSADPQISGGWGVAGRLRGSVLQVDSVETARHCVWLGAQFTPDRRFDLLSTIQVRNAFRSDAHLWLGVGLERRTTVTDLLTELYYDSRARTLHPGIAVSARASTHWGLVGSVTTQSSSLAGRTARRLEVHTLARWFYASDH